MAVPDPRCYFLASQMQHVGGSNRGDCIGAGCNILLNDTKHDTIVEAMEADSFDTKCPTIQMMVKVWVHVKKLLGYTGFAEFSPLWDNNNLKELKKMGRIEEWDRQGIHCLIQLYKAGRLKSFQELVVEYAISNRSFYRYLQIRHALKAQFGGKAPVWCEMSSLRKLINAASTKGLISDIYGSLNVSAQEGMAENKNRIKWEADVGPLSDDQWEYVLSLGPRSTLSPHTNGFSLLFFL